MTRTIAERLAWAVETLAVEPTDQLLEIGCGHGAAVSAICERLTSGRIVAIDRSAAMIAMATKRNHEQIASGKVIFHTAALSAVDLGTAQFNKIFAINVDLSRNSDARDAETIKNLLAPGGRVYLFHQPPVASKVQGLAGELTRYLHDHGFSIGEVLTREMKPAPSFCILAQTSVTSGET